MASVYVTLFNLGSNLYFLAAVLTIKERNWCRTHPLGGLNCPKGFLSEVTVSRKIMGGNSIL